MLASFTGDVFAAWGLYLLLRPVNAAWSMLTAWFRLVYAGAGVNALLNLVTAHRLLNQAGSAVALGRPAFDAKLQESLVSFQAGFDFSLILFGVYLTMVGGLMFRSGYVPRWLGIVIVVNGLGWALMEVGPYVLPGVNLGFLFVTTLGELVLVIWLVGWGLRLKGPERSARLR